MKKEYEYYGDVLTTQESADIGGLIIKFEFLGATYQELKHKLAKRGITLKPYVRDFSHDENQQEIKERVASETFIPSDLIGYIISSDTYQNVLVKNDRQMINALAQHHKLTGISLQERLRKIEKMCSLNSDDNSYRSFVSIDIYYLLTICYIFDDYETFSNNINEFLQSDNPNAKEFWHRRNVLLSKLEKLVNKKTNLSLTKFQKFYNDNKEIIDTISTRLSISDFLILMEKNDIMFSFLYTYIKRNRNELPRIIENLERIYKLGFNKLYFSEWLDFSNDEYKFYDNPNYTNRYNDTVICLENVESQPSYDGCRYKSNNSPYKMILHYSRSKPSEFYPSYLMINDLTINSDRLPEDLDIYTILTKVMKLPTTKPEIPKGIETSVKLGVMIDDLITELEKQAHEVLKLSEIKSPEELKNILQNIRNQIQKISEFKTSYDQELIASCDDVTKELLDEEKQAYVKIKKSKNN